MEMVQRSESAQRSVYVRGFSATPTTEGDLGVVMGQFGGVVSVVVKASRDDAYALVEFTDTDAALAVLRHPSPLTLHTHTLTLKPRILKPGTHTKRLVSLGRKRCVDVAVATADTSIKELKGRDGGESSERVYMIGGIRLTPEAKSAISSAHSVGRTNAL